VREERPGPVARPHPEVVLSDVPEQGLAVQSRAESGARSCRSAARRSSGAEGRTTQRRRMGRAARSPRHTARPGPNLQAGSARPGAGHQPPDRGHRSAHPGALTAPSSRRVVVSTRSTSGWWPRQARPAVGRVGVSTVSNQRFPECILLPTPAHQGAASATRCCAYVVQGSGNDSGSDYLP